MLKYALLTLAAALSLSTAARAAAPEPLDDPYLASFVGSWHLDGTIQNRAAHQTVAGEWVLHHQFVVLHIRGDYVADVYIGYDAAHRRYVLHWLDQFGAAGADAVGIGRRSGESVSFLFHYSDGLFRTTFMREPAKHAWHIRYESQGKNGAWSEFGDEVLQTT